MMKSHTAKSMRLWLLCHHMAFWVLLGFAASAFAEPLNRQWQGNPASIADIDIQVQDPYPEGPDWNSLARVLIDLKPGDILDEQRLAQAKSALAPLAQVQTDVEIHPDGLRLTVQATPYRRIQSIDISGNYPFLEKEVRNAMTIDSGDVFRAAQMPEQESLIAQIYRDKGYVDPYVHISWARTSMGHYQLQVDIDKGIAYTLEELRVRGNQSIGDGTLKRKMSTWRRAVFSLGGMRFTEQRLDEDVQKLIGYYRAQGFADVVIEAETSVHRHLNHPVTAVVNIREGPLYDIDFSGNDFFSNRTLRKELMLFEIGNRGNIGLRRSINQIRRRYVQAGFADVRVRWRDKPPAQTPPATREITIEIEEGRRHIVEQVTIEGNRRIDAETLREQILTRPPGLLRKGAYVAERLQEDTQAIEALYHSKGYLSAQVNQDIFVDPESSSVRVAIRIEEGPQTLVDQVHIEGKLPMAERPLRQDLGLKSGEPYTPFALREDRDMLAARIASQGFPYVDIQSDARLSGDRTQAEIRFDIDPGSHVQVGDIFFVGTLKTDRRFLQREIGFEPQDDFALRQIVEGQRKLRDLEIFESVQVHTIGLKERQDTVHLLVQATEQEPYYFLAGGGYQTDKGFFGRTKIGDRNFTGTAKDLWLSAEVSQVGYRADAGIGEPRLFGTVIRADGSIFIERSEPFNQDFGTDTFGARINLARTWGRFFSTGLGLRYERRENFIREETAATTLTDPDAFDPRSVVVTTPSVLYDSRDSFIRPRSGQLLGLAVDVSKGLDNTLDDFFKYRLEARAYYTLLERVTLAGRAWVGYLQPYGGDVPPLDQLFFLGGTTTVRGFDENVLRFDAEGNPIGGQLAFAAGLETRIDVGFNIELIPFVDTGSVRQSITEGGSEAFRWSAGLGVQYITPIGPIGLFYGHKLDPHPGESDGQWHLSVGYTF